MNKSTIMYSANCKDLASKSYDINNFVKYKIRMQEFKLFSDKTLSVVGIYYKIILNAGQLFEC